MSRTGNCATCRWWVNPTTGDLPRDMAVCRAAPPYGMVTDPHPEVEWLTVPRPVWPATRSTDWCGRHEAKPEDRAAEAARNVAMQNRPARPEDQAPLRRMQSGEPAPQMWPLAPDLCPHCQPHDRCRKFYADSRCPQWKRP